MGKVKRFRPEDAKKIALLQKLENDAAEAKKHNKMDEAVDLLSQCIAGWKEIIADVNPGSITKANTNPDVKFETDDLTKKILKDYFGMNFVNKKEEK